jgi:oligopeptide transport system substrate-binding protein
MARTIVKGVKFWALLAFLAVAILGMAACGGGGKDEGNGVPQVLRARIAGDPETLDPQKGGFATDVSIMRQLFRGLVYFDQNLNVVAAAAEEVPSVENGGISKDGLTYTFKLRDGLKWSDGSPLTAYDWEYSLKRFLDPTLGGNGYYQSFYYVIEGAQEYNTALGTPDQPLTPSQSELASLREGVGVDTVDDHTLQIRLKTASNTFLYLMALWPGYPVKHEVIDSLGDAWTEAGNLVSDGPFMLTEWERNQRLVLERNPYYWGPKPGLDRLELLVIPDETAAYQAYQNGEIDFTVAPPAELATLKANPEFHAEAQLSTFGLLFNTAQKPFDDPAVRKAFARAIDRQAYVDLVTQGFGMPTTGWIPPGTPGFDAEAGQAISFDPEAARSLLSEAGYPEGRGLPAIALATVSEDIGRLSAEFVQEQLKQNLGVNVEIEVLDPPSFQMRVGSGEFQMTFLGWNADYPHAENWIRDLFHTGASANLAGYSNTRVDELIDQAAAEKDPVASLELYKEVQRIILDEDSVVAPIFHSISAFLVKPYVRGLVFTATDGEVRGDVFLASPGVSIAAH